MCDRDDDAHLLVLQSCLRLLLRCRHYDDDDDVMLWFEDRDEKTLPEHSTNWDRQWVSPQKRKVNTIQKVYRDYPSVMMISIRKY